MNTIQNFDPALLQVVAAFPRQSAAAACRRGFALCLAACSAGLALTCQAAPPTIPLSAPGGQQVATLQTEANPFKPYIAQLLAPGEKPVPLLADSPPDHFHHHGLMFALGVDKTDFWTEKGAPNIGTQKLIETKRLANHQGVSQVIRWVSHENKNLLDETRVIRVLADTEPAVNWLVWNSKLMPAAGIAVELEPDNAMHLGDLGWALIDAGRPGEAAVHLRMAIALAPGETMAEGNLAHLAKLLENRLGECPETPTS